MQKNLQARLPLSNKSTSHTFKTVDDIFWLAFFINSGVYCCVDSRKILADVLWETEIHDPSVLIVTGKETT